MCDDYVPPSALNLSLAVFLITGIFFSYVPQFLSIIKRKSSEGLSYPMVALGFLSGLLTVINAGIMNWNPRITCCYSLEVHECLAFNLTELQLLVGPTCMLILYILFLKYYTFTPNEAETRERRARQFKIATIVFVIVFASGLFLSTLAGILYYDVGISSKTMVRYAQVCGGAASIAIVIQWMPQIWTIWKLKDAGSLSLAMLALQAPGSILVIYFQAYLEKQDFTIWAPYVVALIDQLILIGLVIMFKIRNKNKTKDETTGLLREPIQQSPLIEIKK